MIENLKPYPAYKDSGIPWAGNIPVHWRSARLKNSVDGCVNGIWGEEPDGGVHDLLCVRVADFDRKNRSVTLANPTYRKILPSERNKRMLSQGDLLLEKSGGGEKQPVGVVVQYPFDEPAVTSNFVARMPVAKKYHSRFLLYLHQLLYVLRVNSPSIKQTTGIQNLDAAAYLSETFWAPLYEEQELIAIWLDHLHHRIQTYIAAKQRLIKLLEEEKQAVIAQAVTRGLDPTVLMKDTGIPWLGEVPAHWELAPLRRFYDIQLGKMLQPEAKTTEDTLVTYLKAQHVQWEHVRLLDLPKMWASPQEIASFQVENGDLLVCEGGEVGRAGLLKDLEQPAIIQNAVHRVRARDLRGSNEFLLYLLMAVAHKGWLKAITNKATIAHFTQEKFGALMIAMPPQEELQQITDHIGSENERILTITLKVQQEILLLQEYRARLIADVVTGKLDVRDAVTELPELDELPAVEELDLPEAKVLSDSIEDEQLEMELL